MVCGKRRLCGKPRISDGNIQALIHYTDSANTVAAIATSTFCCWVWLSCWFVMFEARRHFGSWWEDRCCLQKLEKRKGAFVVRGGHWPLESR
jgi:hypothetical protein